MEETRHGSVHHDPSFNRYSHLYDFAPVGYFTFDREGTILEVNLTGAGQLGSDRHQLIGRSFFPYLASGERDRFRSHLASLFDGKVRQSGAFRIKGEKERFDARLESLVVEMDEGPVCRSCLIDLSERKKCKPGKTSDGRLYPRGKRALQGDRKGDYRGRAEERLSNKKKIRPEAKSREEMEALIRELELHRIELEMQNEDLRAAQAALELSRDDYSELFDSAPVGYFTFDEKGIVLNVNRPGAGLLGKEPRGLVGMPFILHVAEDHRMGFYAHLNAVFKNKGRASCEIRINRAVKEGKISGRGAFDAELESIYFETPRGRGCRTILTDVTERKEAEEKIRRMNEAAHQKNIQLQEMSRARNRFFSFISHELKTPLNGVLGFAQLLRRGTYGPLNPEQAKALARMASSGGEMAHLINNILDIARIETGKMPSERIETNIPELLERISGPFEPLLKEKGLSLEIRVEPGTPVRFRTNPEQIRSIFANLLSNAVKFTREGGILLKAEPLSRERGIRLTVSDTGIGIKPDDLERIFEEYEQSGFVRENPVRYTSGSGLGLSIVKKLVSLLGGTVRVESAAGKGTTFTVELFEDAPGKVKRPEKTGQSNPKHPS